RHTGTPARLRYGYADYLGPDGFHGDHVVTEYWNDARGWLLADPQLADPRVLDSCHADFDPLDVPRDRFLVAGAAWRAIRTGAADPAAFGVHPPDEGPLNGEPFVAHSLRLDLAMLNKVEPLLWDLWGPAPDAGHPHLAAPLRRLHDQVALLTYDDIAVNAVRTLFDEHEALRTPKTLLSLSPFKGPRTVTLR
ncbi:transglutaminase domain-containing protein, partial [Streptomyces sp. FH025]|nr:transglutaminase domain-containing protein [Streptomyces sp. FH025]